MINTLSLGRRAQLAALGIDPDMVGRPMNTAPAVAPKTVPIPKNSDELAEMMGDPGRLAPVLADRDKLREFIQAYAEQQQGDGSDLRRLVAEESQKVLAQFLRDNDQNQKDGGIKRLNLDPQNRPASMLTSHRQATAYNPAAPGAVLDGKFTNATDYIRNVWHLNTSVEAQTKRAEIMNAFGSISPSDGGFLVPETLRAQLLELALEMSVVRPRATVVPMETARVPFPMIDSTSNASSVFGGMIAYWGEEGANLTDSSAKFGRIVLDAKKLTGLSAVPNELLRDSLISFAALIERLWPEALTFFEDKAFTSGSGVGEPLGYQGNPATIAVSAQGGQPATSIVWENVVNMYSRMLPASLNRAIWTCSPDTLPQLYTMALAVGVGGGPIFLTAGSDSAPTTLLGRPLIVTEKSQPLGTQGDLAFVDLSYYLIGDRQTMELTSSTDFNFGSDKTTFRIIQRVDGRPWLKSAITPANNSANTLSPFVELASR